MYMYILVHTYIYAYLCIYEKIIHTLLFLLCFMLEHKNKYNCWRGNVHLYVLHLYIHIYVCLSNTYACTNVYIIVTKNNNKLWHLFCNANFYEHHQQCETHATTILPCLLITNMYTFKSALIQMRHRQFCNSSGTWQWHYIL